jgi:hypothetical protein
MFARIMTALIVAIILSGLAVVVNVLIFATDDTSVEGGTPTTVQPYVMMHMHSLNTKMDWRQDFLRSYLARRDMSGFSKDISRHTDTPPGSDGKWYSTTRPRGSKSKDCEWMAR